MPVPSAPLTDPQAAALAKLGCGLAGAAGIGLLCGPAGVGKTTVLDRLAADLRSLGRSATTAEVAAWLDPATDLPDVVLGDDAHLADVAELAALLARCRSRRPSAALVLAGEGRLFTLVARDQRLAQTVRIRVALLPGSLLDTAALVTRIATPADGLQVEAAAIATIHEIAGGAPADVVRLATLAGTIAASRPDEPITVADIEAIHRRLSPQAA